ncbi:MAG: glycosyltransferase [Alphaproteobacteria bacterium]|nr:glycosyltransferase [Alphaproteobacteria bacterium]
MPDQPDLSIVVPVYNEAANLDAFFARLGPVLDRLALRVEIVCVDDGSRDDSWLRLTERQRRDPRLRLVRLSRNFGKDIALSAGLQHAAGRAVIPIDADLQHPPELIETLVARWREGYDMVYAQRQSRDTDSRLRRFFSRAFYALFKRLSDIQMPPGAGDFRLLDRRVVDALNAMPERARFMKGLFAWVGFRQTGVAYEPGPRQGGASAWSLTRLVAFAVDGLASFSTFPLVVAGYIGAILAVPSLLLGVYFVVRTLVWGVDVPGYASVMVAVLLLGSIQLLTLGLFGAYLGRVFAEVKGRPLYIVSERAGFEPAEAAFSSPSRPGHRAARPDAGGSSPSPPAAPPAVRVPSRAAAGDP